MAATTYSLAVLAELSASQLRGDPDCLIRGVASLDEAGEGLISFLGSRRFLPYLADTRASAVILTPEHADVCPVNALVTDNPSLAYAKVASVLTARAPLAPGMHPSAVVDESAVIDPTARIEAHCTIGAGVRIAAGVFIGPNCVIADDCEVGNDSRLIASVTLGSRTVLGKRCLIHPGAVLGADGFGLANDQGRWVKIPQLGRVRLGDDVEVGSGTTIDRGALKGTVLHNGVKLDNLIHVAHNVELGENTAIAAQTGIAGSTRIGAGCTLAGQSGVAGHLELADGVHVSGQTAITRSIRAPGLYTSTVPAVPHSAWGRNFARIKQLDDLFRQVRALEKALAETADDQAEN